MSSVEKRKSLYVLLPRVLSLALLDIIVINLAAFFALYIRYEFNMNELLVSGFTDTLRQWCVAQTLLTVGIFVVCQLYSSLWGFAGADELVHIFIAVTLVTALDYLAILLGFVNLPRSLPILYSMILCMATTVIRFSYRFVRRVRARVSSGGRRRTMVIGAGQAGALVLREFRNSNFSQNKVVSI